MTAKPFTASKSYRDSPYILTDRKLIRIVEVARERLDRVRDDKKIIERYDVHFQARKELGIDLLETVLALDNSKKNRITHVVLNFSVQIDDKTGHEIIVVFGADYDYRKGIAIFGTSPDLGWLQETVGALEEQVERTIPSDWIYSIAGWPYLVSVATAVLTLALLVTFATPRSGIFAVPASRLGELIALSKSAKLEAEKTEFIFQYLSSTLSKDTTAESIGRLSKNYRTYLIGIPILVGLLSMIVAIVWFYPRHVFAWGDCGEAYATTVERRKFLWYGVVFSLIIGVLGNLFVVGATG